MMTKHLTLSLLAASTAILPLDALQAQSSASAFTTSYRYDTSRRVTGTIAPDPDDTGGLRYAAVRNTYDYAGRLVRVEYGQLLNWQSDTVEPKNWPDFSIYRTIDSSYDAANRKTRETVTADNGVKSLVEMNYDTWNKPVCTAQRMNPANFGAVTDACSRADGQTDPNSPLQDRITKTFYSGPLLYQVRKGVGTNLEQAYVTYGYTPNQQRQYVIDAKGNRARMDYDGFDRQVGWVFPTKAPPASGFDPSSWSSAINSAYAVDGNDYESYGYDAAGNRTSLRRRDGSTQGFSYDALNRMVTKGGSTIADVSYSYDLAGHQLTATFATGGQGVTNAYNTRGLLTSSTTTMGGVSRAISYQYDADGNRARVTHPDGTYFTYDYDGLDRANLIRENGAAGLVAFGYDWRGQLVGMGRGTGVPTNIGFDNSGRLTSLTHDLAGTNADQTLSFGYNAASQIASRTSSNDAYAWTQHYNVSRGYQSNGQNQYSQISSSATIVPTYDGRGNLTSAGGTTYAYDGDNRLISASGAASANLAYDPLGRLFQISGGSAGTTQFLYDGDELVAEYDASGNLLRRYVHGAGADDPLMWYEGANLALPHYLHSDHQGSVIAVSGATGVAAAINSYDPWGIPSSTNLGRFQYTGQAWLPELGIFYYKARMYSPTLGRFLQTDPIGYDDQINLYAYVGNDPINGTDPSGLMKIGSCLADEKGRADPSCSSITFSEAVAKSPLKSRLISPIKGKISNNQIKSIEKKMRYSSSGPSEFEFRMRQKGLKYISSMYSAVKARSSVDYSAWNDRGDAMRHANWSIRMTESLGEDEAKLVGDAHERSGGNAVGERMMDLINNNNGRVLQQIFPGSNPEVLARYAADSGFLQLAPVDVEE